MPTTKDAEEAVISAMFMDAAAISRAKRLLDATAFTDPVSRSLFNVLCGLDSEGVAVDPLTLSARLEEMGILAAIGGKDYIGYLVDVVPTAANVEYHAKLVRKSGDRRKAQEHLSRALESLKDPKVDPRDVATELQASLLPIAVEADGRGYRWVSVQDVEEVLQEADRRAERVKEGLIPGIPTGYRSIDSVTNGFRLGEFVVFGGAPKSLKSYLCINILINFCPLGMRPST